MATFVFVSIANRRVLGSLMWGCRLLAVNRVLRHICVENEQSGGKNKLSPGEIAQQRQRKLSAADADDEPNRIQVADSDTAHIKL